uniref:Uncharacterized protein n=1 Tax=Anguilla anguilla TaxID=7936 RepID=A0A0E9X7E4_ANGAN
MRPLEGPAAGLRPLCCVRGGHGRSTMYKALQTSTQPKFTKLSR